MCQHIAVIMTEDSRSPCFPHCVSSCFGVRRNRLHNSQQRKLKENEFEDIIVEKGVTVQNGNEQNINGFVVHCQENGKVCSSESHDPNSSHQSSSNPIVTPPIKSSLPAVDTSSTGDAPDSNGHHRCENTSVILENHELKVDSTECNKLNNETIEVHSPNHTQMIENEQSPQTDERLEVTDDSSISDIKGGTQPSHVVKQSSDTSQDRNSPCCIIQKESFRNGMDHENKNIQDYNGEKYHDHFRELLEEEKKKLTSLVNEWSELLLTSISVEVQDEIRSVIGQTNLIITERFSQFSRLISRSEGNCDDNQTNAKTITASDLQGFWDMIFYQVKDVLNKFKKLETVRKNNWDLKYLQSDITPKRTPKKKTANKNINAVDNDKEKARRLAARKRIAEARQRLKDQNQQVPDHSATVA